MFALEKDLVASRRTTSAYGVLGVVGGFMFISAGLLWKDQLS